MYACLHAEGNVALLVECARHFSPRFEVTSIEAVLVDLRGLRLLFGSPEAIADAMSNRAGFPVDIAIASDADTAMFASRAFRGVTIIPSGKEAEKLAPLPLNLLPGSPEAAAILNSWGIRNFGELAALPPLGIAARLGAEGTYLQRLARGEVHRQLKPLQDPLRFEEELELESPIELLESLLFLLGRLLNSLCSQLTSHSLSTDEINLSLMLENAPAHTCTLRLPVPMRDPKIFLKLLQLELDARPPAAPILKILIELKPVEPRREQHNLFVALTPQPEKLEITLSKLSHLVGAENVGTPEIVNTHRPDSFQMSRFNPTGGARKGSPPAKPALVLRRYRPPIHAQVIQENNRPRQIRALSLQGKVVDCLGPWRTSGDWWRTEPWDRDEWDIVLSDGALYRLHEDRRTSRWFVEGVYD